MPPLRWLDYDSPPGPPMRSGRSWYGIAASVVAFLAIVDIVALERHLLPLSLLPLAIPAGACAALAALVACAAASLDQTARHTFTWIGAGMTGAIPLAAWLASDPVVEFARSVLSR